MTTIRPAGPGDAAAVERVVRAAFTTHPDQVAALVRALDDTGATRASLVAEQDGEVVGHVQLSRSWLDARERLVEVLVLSPLSVEPRHQGRGTGTALVAAALAASRAARATAVFLEGSPDYYGARGFRRGSALGFGRPSDRIPEAAFQVATLEAHEPWMTGRLVYCEAFWAHDCVGLRDPDLAEIEERFAGT